MSSVEIEDVLSSVRRLISENLRPSILPIPPAEPADKLILTPALRVVPDAGEGAAGPGPLVLAEPAPEARVPEAQVAEAQREVAGPDHTKGGQAAAEADPPHGPAEAAGDAPGSIEAVVAAVGAAVTGQGWEGEADEPDPEDDWADQAWAEPAREAYGFSAVKTVEEAEVIRPGDPGPAAMAASWEAEQAWAADGDGDPEAAVLTDQVLGDLAEAEAVAQIMQAELGADADAAPAESAEPLAVFDEEEAVLDEEVLRDLVRDIVREELQGALGERITRNVRKLVRAEINRTLASRDLG